MKVSEIGPRITMRVPFRLTNLYSESRDDGRYVVYSYGYHWPLAVYDQTIGWMVNTSQSTKTTERHRRQIEQYLTEGFDTANVTFLRNLIGLRNG